MRFRKISYNPKEGSIELAYQKPINGGHDDYTFSTSQLPHPDFVGALQSLAGVVLDIAELEGVAEVDDIEMRTVNIAYHKNDTVGVVFSAMRRLKKTSAPMLINTPHKLIIAGENASEDQVLGENVKKAVDRLELEARKFVGGKRAQGDLFESKKGEEVPDMEEAHEEAGELVGAGA